MKTLSTFVFFQIILFAAFMPVHAAKKNINDTLPAFTVLNKGYGRIVVGWINNYPNIKQISIQRSFDSLINYKTIQNIADPKTLYNGFMDVKAPNDHMFYRLYILLDRGVYLFSKALKPGIDTSNLLESASTGNIEYQGEIFKPSLIIYTNWDGYVRIQLPEDPKENKYIIKFFDATGLLLFDLKNIKEKDFKIDKTNFYHAGWFNFELFENDLLLEKNKFYLKKDF